MCDTIVATPSATRGGVTLFGKNSDRDPDEAQNIAVIPRKQHKAGETVKCTYMSIPQVAETARVLLSQPFWMFGAEMGANEYGVMIGNEAIFTREKPSAAGLTGMDLLRLALERGKTAREALDTIIRLLEEFGQGGNCGYRHKLYYMNSYLIADASEAYVLECVRSWWAWKKIEGVWSISNVISLEKDFDAVSPGLIENAVKKGWCRGAADFDFRRCYSEPVMTWGSAARRRQDCSRKALTNKHGSLTTEDFFEILRDHGGRGDEFLPEKHGWTVCVHAANKLTRPSQSVGSLVGNVSSKGHFYYVTGAANPCLSPFFPVFGPGTATPAGYLEGGAEYDREAYWWHAEKLHRDALGHFPAALKSVKGRIAGYEKEMLQDIEGAGTPPNQAAIDRYFSRAGAIVRTHGDEIKSLPTIKLGWLYNRYWQGFNKLNAVEIE